MSTRGHATAPDPAEFPQRCESCEKIIPTRDAWCGHQAVCTGGRQIKGGGAS